MVKLMPSREVDVILSRLRVGHIWLTERHRFWVAGGSGAASDDVFLRGLDLWDGLEFVLRSVYGYQGCIMESGVCLDESPVGCRYCGRQRSQERVDAN